MSDIVERLTAEASEIDFSEIHSTDTTGILREAADEITRLQALLSEAERLEKKLQAALFFWMPSVTEEIEISTGGRCGDDAILLAGYDGPFEDQCWGDEIIAREKDARRVALEDAALRVDAKAVAYEEEARDLRGSHSDRRFCASVAVRLRGAASEVRALQSEEC